MRKKESTIRKYTKQMDLRQKIEYVVTYYWYFGLLFAGICFLFVFFVVHFWTIDKKRPQFECAIVNSTLQEEEISSITKSFAHAVQKEEEQILFCDYLIVEENKADLGFSNYEKLFFKWGNGELDAIIMPESFYSFCVQAGGSFFELSQLGLEDDFLEELQNAETSGEKLECCAVFVSETALSSYFEDSDETWLLVFPDTGKHRELSKQFYDLINGKAAIRL